MYKWYLLILLHSFCKKQEKNNNSCFEIGETFFILRHQEYKTLGLGSETKLREMRHLFLCHQVYNQAANIHGIEHD